MASKEGRAKETRRACGMGAAAASPDLLPLLGDGSAGMPLAAAGAEPALPLAAPGAVLERGWLAKGEWYMLE